MAFKEFLIDYTDLFNVSPQLFVGKRESFSSKLGIVMGIMTLLTISALVIYLTVDYFNKTQMNVLVSTVTNIYPSYDWTNRPLMFALTTAMGLPLNDSVVNFSPMLLKVIPSISTTPIITQLSYAKCDLERHFGEYKPLFLNFTNLGDYYCLDTSSYNLTLKGAFGDLKNGYSYFNLFSNVCRNNSVYNYHNTTCSSASVIDNTLKGIGIYLRFSYVDISINNKLDDPIVPYVKSEAFQISSAFFPRYLYSFNNIEYSTDVGYFGSTFVNKYFSVYDQTSVSFALSNPFIVPESFSLMTFTLESYLQQYQRSYPKLQTLIANIGGVFKGIALVSEYLIKFFSSKMIFLHYFNSISFNSEDLSKKDVKNISTNSKDNILHLQTKHSKGLNNLFENAKSKFKLGTVTMTFGICCRRKMKQFKKNRSFIKRLLSVEYLLKHLTEYELFKKVILKENQLEVFNRLPKLDLDVYRKLEKSKKDNSQANLLRLVNCLDESEQVDKELLNILNI